MNCRRSWGLGLAGLVLAVLLAGCSTNRAASTTLLGPGTTARTAASSTTTATTSPTTTTITPSPAVPQSVVDPACAAGAGTVFPVPLSWLDGAGPVVSTELSNGVILVVVSAGYPPASFALAYAFTSNCAPDRAFGHEGVERLTLGGETFAIEAAAPALGGGAILAGGTDPASYTGGTWLVGRIDQRGRLDSTFGNGGWSKLSWEGSAYAVSETPSGRIVVGGSLGGGCCVQEWVGELSANGATIHQFGSGGRSRIPVYRDDSGVVQVAVEPGGDILALTDGGNMGYWGVSVSALTSAGSPVPSFQPNFNAAMQHVSPSGVFVGDIVLRGSGFLLVGTEQNSDVGITPSTSARGRIIAFQGDGKVDPSFASSGQASFSSRMAQSVWALPQRDGDILMMAAPVGIQLRPDARLYLRLIELSASGSVDHDYGHDGIAELKLPYINNSNASTVPITALTNGQVCFVTFSVADLQALKLIAVVG